MIIVYSKDLTNFKEINHALSIQMEEHYNNIGKAIITLPIDNYNISTVENGGIIYDTIRDMSFVIRNHKYDTSRTTITINAYTCNRMLNKRAIIQKNTINNIENGVRAVVKNNLRGLPNVELGELSGFDDATETMLYGGQVLDEIMPILETAKIGNRMRWDADRRIHVFELYKGRDLTEGIHAVVFSDEYKTAKDLVIASDDSVFKNVIYVPGTLKDGAETEIVVEVGATTGDDRFEKWLDRSFIQDDEETESQFRERLKQIGLEEIAKLVSRRTFSVAIDTKEYGTTYKLGDIVSCVSQRFGVELKSRITSVKYTLDIAGEKINLILGEPILTVVDELKLSTRVSNQSAQKVNNPVYQGAYTVVPRTHYQTLETAGMLMMQNTLIEEIPLSVASNNSGGTTATIG
jgi:hypothetical protein